MNKKHLHLLIFVFFTPYIYIQAQNIELKVFSKDSILTNEFKTIHFKKNHSSKNSAIKSCDSISNKLSYRGYFDNYYKVKLIDSIVFAEFHSSKKIDTIIIHFNNEEIVKKTLNQLSVKFSNTVFKIQTDKAETLLERLITNYEEEGYPFTSVKLSNVQLKNNKILADLIIKNQVQRKINNIVIKGYEKFPKKKLKKLINIKQNTIFNTTSLKSVENKITETKHFYSIKKPEVLFTKDSTQLYIYVKKQSNSQFNGLVAFSNEDGEKLQLNGFFNLKLSNIFNRAEEISLNWIGNKQQNTLDISYNTPYIFNSNLNFEGAFKLVRKDSTYVNLNTNFKLGYHITNNVIISSIFNFENSEASNKNLNTSIQDYKKTFYGVSFNYNLLKENHLLNNKLNIETSALLGNRNETSTKTNQQQFSLKLNYLLKLSRKNYIYLKSLNSYLESDTTFENELFRIGGFNTIRGFAEESILTSKFSSNTIEYHRLTNNQSYLYSFIDLGIINNELKNSTNNLYGVGIGYNFTTKKSILNIAYAIGKFQNTPIEFQNSKILIKTTLLF